MKKTMNIVTTRTSGFLKVGYFLKNYLITFAEIKNFESYFHDFSEHTFQDQVKIIYFEVINAISRNDTALLQRLLSQPLLENKVERGRRKEYIFEHQLSKDAKDFEIVHARTFYGGDLFGDLSNTFAQATIKFNVGRNNDKYLIMERMASNSLSYLDWKIICFDYENIKV